MVIKNEESIKIKFDKEAGVYVSYCPVFGIYSQGLTSKEAKLALEDAVEGFLIVALKFIEADKKLITA